MSLLGDARARGPLRGLGAGLAAVLLASLFAPAASAQVGETGAVVGTVLDERGLPMASASVVLRSLNPPFRQEQETDPEGRYAARGLRAGRYHLLLLREGQLLWSFPVTLPPGQPTLRVDIDLKKLREAAEAYARLDPELERRLAEERERSERLARLHGHLNRAMRLLSDEKAEQAVEEYRVALEMEPDNGALFGLLGSALAKLGRTEEAREALEQALVLEPAEAAHHNNLGTLLAGEGKVEEALAHFRRAAQLDSERAASYLFNQGALLLNSQRPEEAIAPLRQAVHLEPTNAGAHFFLALGMLRRVEARSPQLLQERSAERAEIINAFQRYLQLAPEGPYARQAHEYLERLGAAPPPMLLPQVPLSEDLP